MITTTLFTGLLVFLNILLIEIILSIDNASVLAVMVNKNLTNPKDRQNALKYGIIGAYVFRGLSLLLVSYIIHNPSIGAWFKILGGAYLCYLFYTHLTPEADSIEEGANLGFLEKITRFFKINKFWSTVIMVEFLDIVFSLDNLVACVSMSNNIWVICGAVFLGILGMRFVAQYFSVILEKYPSLENSAFFVILLLGVKMLVAGAFDLLNKIINTPLITKIHDILNSEHTDMYFSLITISVFMYPIMKSKLNKKN